MSGLDVRQKLTAYFQTCPYPVTLAYLFGSAARGQTTCLSDVDVAVYVEAPRERRVKEYLKLRYEINRAMGNGEVDVVYLNDAWPLLAYNAIQGELLYCADERKRVEIEAQALTRRFDVQPLLRVQSRFLRRRVLAGKMGERTPEMIDRQVVESRIRYINAALTRLKKRRSLSFREFKSDEDQRDATLYQLQTCIEAMTDIGNHLVAALGLREPRDRSDIMVALGEAGIIPAPLAKRLAVAVGLRNILVHGYLELVLEMVYNTIQNDLGDVEAFCRHVIAYLDRELPIK